MGEICFLSVKKHLRSQRYAASKRIQKKTKVSTASVSVMTPGVDQTTIKSNQM